jgi:8-oxo-dGTP pyrophosphatase MutT (NUDIX family)
MARSGYVARIREKIGTDPLMLQAVSVFIFDAENRFLLAQQHGHDNWVTIGGAIEMGETPADAAVRECWEETGALIRPTRILGVFGGNGLKITYNNGDVVFYTGIGFAAEIVSGEPKPDGEELRRLEWVSRDQLDTLPMMPAMRDLIRLCVGGSGDAAFQPATWKP